MISTGILVLVLVSHTVYREMVNRFFAVELASITTGSIWETAINYPATHPTRTVRPSFAALPRHSLSSVLERATRTHSDTRIQALPVLRSMPRAASPAASLGLADRITKT